MWAGKSIHFDVKGELKVRVIDGREPAQLGKNTFRALPAPRVKLKNGKEQNIWSVKKYLSCSSKLAALLNNVEVADQVEVLENIIGPNIRVFGGLEWAQSAQYPRCTECNANMKFIVQVAGTWFEKTLDFDVHESEIYIFGCEKHPTQLEKVVQFY